MSEYELGLMRQRARQAYLQKVNRGTALWQVALDSVAKEDKNSAISASAVSAGCRLS
jgi:hypothetical protein